MVTPEPHRRHRLARLRDQLQPGEYGLFSVLRTRRNSRRASKRSFRETLLLPKELADRADLLLLSHNLPADFAALRQLMMGKA